MGSETHIQPRYSICDGLGFKGFIIAPKTCLRAKTLDLPDPTYGASDMNEAHSASVPGLIGPEHHATSVAIAGLDGAGSAHPTEYAQRPGII